MKARIVAVALMASGCAINPRPTFDETNAMVMTRTGFETTWMRSEAEEAAAIARVREMLKEPLSPRKAAQIALINNRALQASLEELGVAHANLAAAGLPGNPEVEGFIGWPSEKSASKKIDLGFGMDILDLVILPSRRNLARLELKQAKALAGNQILEVAARAQTEAYELQALEATASITAAGCWEDAALSR